MFGERWKRRPLGDPAEPEDLAENLNLTGLLVLADLANLADRYIFSFNGESNAMRFPLCPQSALDTIQISEHPVFNFLAILPLSLCVYTFGLVTSHRRAFRMS